jgi:hypothetical protein
VPTVAGDFRLGKGDLLGLWALFAGWQYIMSVAMVFGPPARRAFFGSVLWPGPTLAGFRLFPAPDRRRLHSGPDRYFHRVGRDRRHRSGQLPLPSGTYENRLT